MDSNVISQYTGMALPTVDRLLQMKAERIYEDPVYLLALESLDKTFLEATLPLARKAYEGHLQEFSTQLQQKYRLSVNPMSAFTLGNWVVGILQYPNEARKLMGMHTALNGEIIADGLPELLAMLEGMPRGSREWQQALCLLAFPLLTQ